MGSGHFSFSRYQPGPVVLNKSRGVHQDYTSVPTRWEEGSDLGASGDAFTYRIGPVRSPPGLC